MILTVDGGRAALMKAWFVACVNILTTEWSNKLLYDLLSYFYCKG